MIVDDLLGYPILLLPADLTESDTQRSSTIDLDEFEGDVGSGVQRSRGGQASTTEQVHFYCESREKLGELEDFLRTLAGRHQPFWLPTWNEDVVVLGASFFFTVIKAIGYSSRLVQNPIYRKILIFKRSDVTHWFTRFINTAVDNGDGTETLEGTVGFPYPGEFSGANSQGYFFTFPRFVRLDSDDIEIEYLSPETAEVTLQVTHLLAEAP